MESMKYTSSFSDHLPFILEQRFKLTSSNIQREAGKVDGIEQFNFYSPEFDDHDKVPDCIKPFMDEITAFCDVRLLFLSFLPLVITSYLC